MEVAICDLQSIYNGIAYPSICIYRAWLLMLSSVLNSERAVQINIQIMRVFVKFRQLFLDNEDIRQELEELKQITDERFQIVFETLDQLIKMENPCTEFGQIEYAKAERLVTAGKAVRHSSFER